MKRIEKKRLFFGNLVKQNACKQTKVLANKPKCWQTNQNADKQTKILTNKQNSSKQTKFVCQNSALRQNLDKNQNLDKQINPFHIQITLTM